MDRQFAERVMAYAFQYAYRVKEVAEISATDPELVRNAIGSGILPGRQLGRLLLVPIESVQNWLDMGCPRGERDRNEVAGTTAGRSARDLFDREPVRFAYNCSEAARLCGTSSTTIAVHIHCGWLDAKKVGRRIIVPVGSLKAWLDWLPEADYLSRYYSRWVGFQASSWTPPQRKPFQRRRWGY